MGEYTILFRDVHETLQAEAETEAEAFRSEAEAEARRSLPRSKRHRGICQPPRGLNRGLLHDNQSSIVLDRF